MTLGQRAGRSDYDSLDDAYKLDDVRMALRRGDVQRAVRQAGSGCKLQVSGYMESFANHEQIVSILFLCRLGEVE